MGPEVVDGYRFNLVLTVHVGRWPEMHRDSFTRGGPQIARGIADAFSVERAHLECRIAPRAGFRNRQPPVLNPLLTNAGPTDGRGELRLPRGVVALHDQIDLVA